MTTRLLFAGILVIALIATIPVADATEFVANTTSESCIAWSYTPTGGGADQFTQLILDGYVVRNLSSPDNPDHGYIILCGFPANTCHRLDAMNETDENYATSVACTTGFDWDAKLLAIFVFSVWIICFLLANAYMDGVFALATLGMSMIAFTDPVLKGLAFLDFNIAWVMVAMTIYINIAVWTRLIKRWRSRVDEE